MGDLLCERLAPIKWSMENSNPRVLTLPPRPPTAIDTAILAWASLATGLSSSATFFAAYHFPAGETFMQVAAVLCSVVLLIAALILGLRAVTGESKRTQYKSVVENYSKLTGDHRYDPYVFRTRMPLISILFAVSMIASFVLPLGSLIGGLS